MGDSRVQLALTEQSRMEGARTNFDTYWQDVAERVDPGAAYFTTPDRTPGEKRAEKQFDSTATIALGRATAAFESMVTPRTQKWHGLTASASGLKKNPAVQIYLEAFRDLLFKVRYSTRANFANQNSEFIRSFLNYGNGIIYTDDDPGRSLRYKAIHLAESYFGEDHTGRVDRFHRKFKLTARQLATKFRNTPLPFRIAEAAEKQPDLEFEVLHRVCVNPEMEPKRADWRGMPLVGFYVLPSEQLLLDAAGFYTMPYQVARYRVNAREVYGRGPVMDVLASIKTANEMQKTNLRVGQRAADPPLLAHRDGMMNPFSMRGGHMNYGGLDEQGRQLVQPLQTAGNLPVALEMQQAERGVINDALFVTLFQILSENPVKTATQVLEEVQQRGVLMSPPVGRLQTEAYGPMIEREVDILSRAGGGAYLLAQLGEMPEELRKAGADYEIEYDAPINKAQKAEEGVAIMRTLEAAIPLAKIDPGVLKVIKPRETLRALAEINGMPARLMSSEDEIEALEEDEQAQQGMQDLLAAAPVLSESAKNLAQAESLAGIGGTRQLPGQIA